MRHTPHHGHHHGTHRRQGDHRSRGRQREGQRLGGRGHRRHRHTMAVEDRGPMAHTPRHSEGGGGAEAGIIIRSEDTHRHARHAHRHRSGGTRRRHHAGKAQPQVTDAPQRTLTHWHTRGAETRPSDCRDAINRVSTTTERHRRDHNPPPTTMRRKYASRHTTPAHLTDTWPSSTAAGAKRENPLL